MIPGYDTAKETMGEAVFDLARRFPQPPPFAPSTGWGATPSEVGGAALDAFLALPSTHPCDATVQATDGLGNPIEMHVMPCPRGCKDGYLTNGQVLGGE